VFVRARAAGADEPAPAGAFWRCPACGHLELRAGEQGLTCESCRRTWALRDGIYDFRDTPA
jgi:hypothetical protein